MVIFCVIKSLNWEEEKKSSKITEFGILSNVSNLSSGAKVWLTMHLNPLNAEKFSKNIFYCRLLFKTLKFCLFFMGNDRLSVKQVGSQASR